MLPCPQTCCVPHPLPCFAPAGGGIMLHLWLWPDEARELTAALMADTSWA